MKRIVILISGRGSNMQAILEAKLDAMVCAVISNKALERVCVKYWLEELP